MLLPESICLRSISDDDLPLLQQIYCSTREVELAQVAWTAQAKNAFLTDQFNLQHRHYQEHFSKAEFYIVEYRVGGIRHDVGRLYLDLSGAEFRLIDIALLTAWRNQGIGSTLLHSLLASADEQRREIAIHVEANNPALSLYRRLGFEMLTSDGVYLKLHRKPMERQSPQPMSPVQSQASSAYASDAAQARC